MIANFILSLLSIAIPFSNTLYTDAVNINTHNRVIIIVRPKVGSILKSFAIVVVIGYPKPNTTAFPAVKYITKIISVTPYAISKFIT